MTIKIVDEGGGIRRSDLQRVWSYMYSTAPRPTASQLTGVPLDHMSGEPTRKWAARVLASLACVTAGLMHGSNISL